MDVTPTELPVANSRCDLAWTTCPSLNLGTTSLAPSHSCIVVRNLGGGPEIATPKWGLLPRFVVDPKRGAKPINARVETVATNGFFKQAFARRRCLIPADGSYEPEENDRGEKTVRWWHFKFEDDRPFGFAGLWESWGEGHDFTLITTDPMEVVSECGHQRSPVIVPAEHYDLWLDPEAKPPQLKKLLVPHPSDEVVGYPVDAIAKDSRNDGSSRSTAMWPDRSSPRAGGGR